MNMCKEEKCTVNCLYCISMIVTQHLIYACMTSLTFAWITLLKYLAIGSKVFPFIADHFQKSVSIPMKSTDYVCENKNWLA